MAESSGKEGDLSILLSKAMNKLAALSPAQPCLLCGAMSHDGVCCQPCREGLPRLASERCPVCALPVADGRVCGHCLHKPPAFTLAEAPYRYTYPLDRLIQAFKFGQQLQLGPMFAQTLAEQVREMPDVIIPMPLHPARLRERGYNQSLELARELSRRLSLPVLAEAASRLRDTAPQSSLQWRSRSKNVRKAFGCTGQVAGKHVALVDDVMTTGATLDELARTVKAAGADKVSVWVVARTLPRSG
jgi:ComF family protein